MIIDTQYWIDVINQINADQVDEDEIAVPITDSAYWAEQIHNLSDEEDYDLAVTIAEDIATYHSD